MDTLVFLSSEASLSTIGKGSQDGIWKAIQRKYNLSEAQLERFIEEFWAMDFLDIDLLNAFTNLRKNYKTAILSNFWVGARETVGRLYNIQEGITADRLFFSCEIGFAKPDPRIYRYVSDQLGTKLDNILFVDDFIENIDAANALGMKTLHFKESEIAIDLFNKLAGIYGP
ncbi:MAG: HAD-IA family hydrolase [Anaerolineaceae bacterium]|nr:HAD-IA family hydrolase [Anaerolineaceae bacterium]